MRAIDGDILEKKLKDAINMCMSIDTSGLSELKAVLEDVEEMPTIEPEIVRCKDCKHQVKEWRTDKRLKNKGYMVCGCEVVGDACGYWALLGQDEDFCSYAERRTDEQDSE